MYVTIIVTMSHTYSMCVCVCVYVCVCVNKLTDGLIARLIQRHYLILFRIRSLYINDILIYCI